MADELKDALERMKERFPVADGWKEHEVGDCGHDEWVAIVLRNVKDTHTNMGIDGSGPTPHAAVDAAIKAWDSAVKADALVAPLKAECEAGRSRDAAIEEGPVNMPRYPWAELDIARAATDKSGALR